MERKIWILILLVTFLNVSKVKSQGFVIDSCKTEVASNSFISSQFNIYNFNTDSTVEIPPYAYCPKSSFLPNLLDEWYLVKSTYHPNVERIIKNLPVGRNIHYIDKGNHIVFCCPETNLLGCYSKEDQKLISIKTNGYPFGLAINESLKEVYVSGFQNRAVYVFDIQDLILKDSIIVNGASLRFLAFHKENNQLYAGIRSSKSITKIDLKSHREVEFQKTNNIPGPIFSSANFVYYFQKSENVLAKFDCKNLQLLECRRFQSLPTTIKFNLKANSFILKQEDCFVLNDTIGKADYYYMNNLDSSGRYTWVINSYTNPKWALVAKKSFEAQNIKCYISSLNDGYYRLCAGLYPNQELAVQEHQKFPDLFNGAWLMTIHPHKF